MKGFLIVGALAIFGQSASATPELKIASGAATPVVVTGGGSSVFYSNSNFNGWNIMLAFGVTNSPSLSGVNGLWGIDLHSTTATCSGGPCSTDPLHIWLSDTGFTQITPGFTTEYSNTGTGSTTQSAWFDTSNTIFGTGTLIGTINITGTGGGSVPAFGPAGPDPYSLTIEDVFDVRGGAASFSADGSITTPEPGAVLLFGTAVMLSVTAFRRRQRRS